MNAHRLTCVTNAGFERTPLKIAIAGAGAAGICLAIKILQAQKSGRLGPVDTLVFERAEGALFAQECDMVVVVLMLAPFYLKDYGGTW